MAAAMLRVWESQGRPWRLATPLLDMVAKLKAAYPQLVYGTLGDDAHLNAVPPEDHTPFSATGYPNTSPYPVVHALDVMHHPESGVDAGKLFAYWLAEAKAGRMPWLKYLIWQARIYDVRNGWRAQASSGHFDHVHLSARTDAENTHLGDWSPVPPMEGGHDVPVFVSCQENGGQYMYGCGQPKWFLSIPARDNAMFAFGVPAGKVTVVDTLDHVRDSFGPIPGVDLPADAHGNVLAPPAGGGSGPTAPEIATAVVDEMHNRLAD